MLFCLQHDLAVSNGARSLIVASPLNERESNNTVRLSRAIQRVLLLERRGSSDCCCGWLRVKSRPSNKVTGWAVQPIGHENPSVHGQFSTVVRLDVRVQLQFGGETTLRRFRSSAFRILSLVPPEVLISTPNGLPQVVGNGTSAFAFRELSRTLLSLLGSSLPYQY